MGNYIRRGRIGAPMVATEKRGSFTQARRETFLNHLAATCNVREACAAAGVHNTSAYALRRRDAAFAEQWRAALLTGYDTLEAALVEHAMKALHLVDPGPATEAPPFDPEVAIRILGMHFAQQRARASGARSGPRVKRATEEETNEALRRQLAALDRRIKAEAAREAARAARHA